MWISTVQYNKYSMDQGSAAFSVGNVDICATVEHYSNDVYSIVFNSHGRKRDAATSVKNISISHTVEQQGHKLKQQVLEGSANPNPALLRRAVSPKVLG